MFSLVYWHIISFFYLCLAQWVYIYTWYGMYHVGIPCLTPTPIHIMFPYIPNYISYNHISLYQITPLTSWPKLQILLNPSHVYIYNLWSSWKEGKSKLVRGGQSYYSLYLSLCFKKRICTFPVTEREKEIEKIYSRKRKSCLRLFISIVTIIIKKRRQRRTLFVIWYFCNLVFIHS